MVYWNYIKYFTPNWMFHSKETHNNNALKCFLSGGTVFQNNLFLFSALLDLVSTPLSSLRRAHFGQWP